MNGVRDVRSGREGALHEVLAAGGALLVAELVARREVGAEEDQADAHDAQRHGRADPDAPRLGPDPLRDPAPDAVRGVSALIAVVRNEGPKGAPAEDRQQRREQRAHDEHGKPDCHRADQGQPGGAVHLSEREAQQGSHDRGGRRHDWGARGGHRSRHSGVLVLLAAKLLAVAGNDQQRVVGTSSEDQHRQDRRGLSGHRHAQLGQQVAESA